MAGRVRRYNPAFLSGDELRRAFVVREKELEVILQTIRENVTKSNQHVLVTGPRGIGKTMLVLRVAEEVRRDEDLRGKWYPLPFAEESYPVTTAGEFWLEALFHLAHRTDDLGLMRSYDEIGEERDEERLRERALARLMDFADKEGKRVLLIVENLNMLLGDQMSESDAWVLRETLLHEARIMLLATATNQLRWEMRGVLQEEIAKLDKAMFELFKIYELKPLNLGECRVLLRSITGRDSSEDRIRPIEILTGGNPRLLTIVSDFAAKMSLRELMDDLMGLVDENTEYFKSHLDGLPAVERKVYLGLAELWGPSSAREVAEIARLDVNKTSSLLRRLIERGVVVEADAKGRAKLYQVAERMYNIYYLMRRHGGPSRRAKALVRFMVSFYEPEELVRAAQRIAEEACELGIEERREHYFTYEGIVEAVDGAIRKRLLRGLPGEFFEMPDIPESLLRLAQDEREEKVGAGSEEALRLVKKAEELSKKAETVGEAEALYRKAIEIEPEMGECWLRWLRLGEFLHRKLERYEEAEEAYRRAIELKPESAWGWGLLGELLHEKLGRYDEAEKAYRRTIQLEPEVVWGWGRLGELLDEKLGRYDEAEKAYRKAIELEPEVAWGWVKLGELLHEKLGRYEEAEEAYRRVIELAPEKAYGWARLGELLHERLGRYEEAEEAYRKALEISPNSSYALSGMIRLVLKEPARWAEAVELGEQQIAQRSEDAGLLNALAWVFYEDGPRALLGHAEGWARKAVRLEPGNGGYQRTLASILCESGNAPEALKHAEMYLKDTAAVRRTVPYAIELFIGLAASGQGRKAVEIIEKSDSAECLEPLIAGIKLYLGEDVKSAVEIVEVGRDVVKRIAKKKLELEV